MPIKLQQKLVTFRKKTITLTEQEELFGHSAPAPSLDYQYPFIKVY